MGTAGLKPVDVFIAGPASEKQMRHRREIKARVIGGIELTLGRLQQELGTLSTPHFAWSGGVGVAWNGAFLSCLCHEKEQKWGDFCYCGFFVFCFVWGFLMIFFPLWNRLIL